MILRGQLFSRALEMETGIAVLTPDDLSGDEPVKVAYLLHGTCGSGQDFLHYSMLPLYAKQYRCVFVMPDAVRSLYTDMAAGQDYFTYVAEELPQLCKDLFRISAEPGDTYVIGNSSGGYGALKCALTYPDRYAAACANAPGAVLLKQYLRDLRMHGVTPQVMAELGEGLLRDFRCAFGEDFAWTQGIDLLTLAGAAVEAGVAHTPRLLVQIGREDGLLESNREFAREMRNLPFDFTYEETEGAHHFAFFDRALARALAFCMNPAG